MTFLKTPAVAKRRRARRAKTTLATQTTDLAMAVPQVVNHRLLRLMAAGPAPNARDRQEFATMGLEKMAAFFESWQAMWMQSLQMQSVLASAWMRGRPASPLTAAVQAEKVLSAGMAPVRKRAVANARRLKKVPIVK